jgi:hypothetical protein
MKSNATKALILALVLALAGMICHPAAVLADEEAMTTEEKTRLEEISAEEMMVDFFLLRPAGFMATVVGSAFFVVSLPLNYATGATEPAYEKLIIDPVNYTFLRTLGDF